MEGGIIQNKQMKILLSLAVFMAIVMMGSFATLNFEKVGFLNPSPAVITVSGTGEVIAIPDIGQFTFSVMAEGEDASAVQEESGVKINQIITYLKEQGIEDKDIKTSSYNLYPKWNYRERICPVNSYCPPGERYQDGFTVNQSVSVKLRDTNTAGEIIAGVGERGATDISGLDFTIDDIETLQDEARAKAIEDAKSQADVLANQLGVKIVRLVNFSEGSNRGFYPMMETKVAAFDMDMVEESMGFGGADIPTGEQATVANVTLTYQVK